jgi:predicted phosphodiesterase
LLVTVDDLSLGQDFPDPIVVKVTNVNWDAGKSRRAEVSLLDTAGNPLQLIDYDGAEISIRWKETHWYRVSHCKVQHGGSGFDVTLAPSKRTQIEPLGPTEQCTRLLVIGDTHIGRTTHPKTGNDIDPLGALITAVEYGIEQDVDAVTHVGDIFHESATELQALLVDQRVFEPLGEAGIPFYYLRGNHAAPPGDEILADRNGTITFNLNTGGVTIDSTVRLFGINHHTEGNLPWSQITFPTSADEPVSILLLHQTLQQLSGNNPESIDLHKIQRRFDGSFDFVASGHHHDATRKTWQGVPVMYTGAAEHMSTNNNPDDRIAWLLTIENDSILCDRYDIP